MTLTKLQFKITFAHNLGILGGAGLFSRGSHRISGSSVSQLSGKLKKGSVTLTDGTIVSHADDGVKFSKGGKSTSVVDDLADNPRNRGSLADDFARGCTSSLFDLKQQLAQLKVTQIASLSLTAEMLKPQNSSFLKDGDSFDIAKKLCGTALDNFVAQEFSEQFALKNGSGTILEYGINNNVFEATSYRMKRAPAYKAKLDVPNTPIKKGYYYHMDTQHGFPDGAGVTRGSKGIEFYNKQGVHEGVMSIDGKFLTESAADGRTLFR